MKAAAFFLSVVFVPAVVSAATLRVPDEFSTIQAAMDAARSGDEVRVAAGTYTDCTHPFTVYQEPVLHCVIMKDGVALIGEGGPESTIIDAQRLGRVMLADSCGSGTRVEGFTFTGGHTQNPQYGAGLRCTYSSIEFRNVIFSDNETYGNGGGAAIIRGGNRFIDCVFSGNHANSYYGGGVYCISSDTAFETCRFTGNTAATGGAIVCDFTPGTPTFTNCCIDRNTAVFGGGIWASNGSPAVFDHCTIADNTASNGASLFSYSSRLSFVCSILAFGNGPAMRCPSSVSFECCDIYGHTGGDDLLGTDVGGTFFLDPQFQDRTSGNYELMLGSPCQPGNHPAGCDGQVIGAFPPSETPVKTCTWGSIKAAFRNKQQ